MRALSEPFPPPPFTGFDPAAFAFLRSLAERQDKVWFAAHKADYERHVRGPMESLVTDLSVRLAACGLPFRGDPRRALFRPQRDTRFSHDKRPYKPHASAALTRDGVKQTPGVFYIHIDPAGSFMAAGFFRPEPDALHRLRAAIGGDARGWRTVGKALGKSALDLRRDDALVRPPKGFDHAGADVADDLRLKSWIVRRDLGEAAIGNAGLVDVLGTFATQAAPLLKFGWRALDKPPERGMI